MQLRAVGFKIYRAFFGIYAAYGVCKFTSPALGSRGLTKICFVSFHCGDGCGPNVTVGIIIWT